MAPGLAVDLDGENLVTVATDGLDLVDIQVHGDVISEEVASLYISGGSHPDGAESSYLIWVDNRPLRPGSVVAVTFLESAMSSRAGKTIDELFPEKEPPTGSWQPSEVMFDELAKRPKVHERFKFEVVPPAAQPIHAVTELGDHSFAFSVLWNSFHPERARVSLSSTTLENIRTRSNGTYHA